MDGVITGLVGGTVTSVLLVFGGLVTYYKFYNNSGPDMAKIYTWLILLTGLTMGQLVLTYFLVSTFAESPSQTTQATVK